MEIVIVINCYCYQLLSGGWCTRGTKSENYSEVKESQIPIQTDQTEPDQQSSEGAEETQWVLNRKTKWNKTWNCSWHVPDEKMSLLTDSDAHSTTSSASPAQSPSYSNQSDEGSDSELTPGSARSPVFSFLDLTYWKRYSLCRISLIYKFDLSIFIRMNTFKWLERFFKSL